MVFVIGEDLPVEKLQSLASEPHEKHLFRVDNYSELEEIAGKLTEALSNKCNR